MTTDSSPLHGRRLAIVGGGRAGWAIATIWSRIGVVSAVALRPHSRSPLPSLLDVPRVAVEDAASEADLVALAVTDDALPSVAPEVAARAADSLWLFHLSGAVPSDVFGRHRQAFSLHPLHSLPPAGEAVAFDGTLFVFEGLEDGRELARAIVDAAGGRFGEIGKDQKLRYHAAAVFGSNHVAALLDLAAGLMAEAGVARPEVESSVARLAETAISNWARRPGGGRFTGPASRGDLQTVSSHLALLEPEPLLREIYRLLALVIAERSAAAAPSNDRLRKLVEELKRASDRGELTIPPPAPFP